MRIKNITYYTSHLYIDIRKASRMNVLPFSGSPCIMKIANPKPIPYPIPRGFDKPCAAAAACSAFVSLKYTKESVNHVSRISVTSGVVVLIVSK